MWQSIEDRCVQILINAWNHAYLVLLELNADIDVNGREPVEVAYEWMKKEGFSPTSSSR